MKMLEVSSRLIGLSGPTEGFEKEYHAASLMKRSVVGTCEGGLKLQNCLAT